MSASILFICGSLNAGRNGVGDYTRVLAGHLQTQGCITALIATHDVEVDGVIHEQQHAGNHAIPTLRISRKTSHALRWKAVSDHVNDVDPEIISLQFVPFAFHSKGFPRRFVQQLGRPAFRHRQWHVMFHELWVGAQGSSVKSRLLRLGQQWLIKKLYEELRPVMVHSHLPIYIEELKSIGIPASPLPLFANVATGGTRGNLSQVSRGGVFRLAFFSQMELSSPVTKFLGDLVAELHDTTPGGSIEVLLIGGNAAKIAETGNGLAALFPALGVMSVGFLSDVDLLSRLESVHLGITPVPLHALGKSGTVAAFLMQRVPVAAPKVTKLHPPFLYPEFNSAILTEFSTEAFLAARRAARDLPTEWITPQRVARNFREDLQQLGFLSLQNSEKNSPCA